MKNIKLPIYIYCKFFLDFKFKTVTTTDVEPFTLEYPVNNVLSAAIYGRYANHHEHPLRLENIWQDHQRLQFQEQVNTWNRMMYRYWKLQQQQHLIPYYQNAWCSKELLSKFISIYYYTRIKI